MRENVIICNITETAYPMARYYSQENHNNRHIENNGNKTNSKNTLMNNLAVLLNI